MWLNKIKKSFIFALSILTTVTPIVLLSCTPTKPVPTKINEVTYETNSIFLKNEANRNKYWYDHSLNKKYLKYYEMVSDDNRVVFVISTTKPKVAPAVIRKPDFYTPEINRFELLNSYNDYVAKIKERLHDYEKLNDSIKLLDDRLKTVDFNKKSMLVVSLEDIYFANLLYGNSISNLKIKDNKITVQFVFVNLKVEGVVKRDNPFSAIKRYFIIIDKISSLDGFAISWEQINRLESNYE